MKRTHEHSGKTLDQLLARHAEPSPDRMQPAIDRVAQRLRMEDRQHLEAEDHGLSDAWSAPRVGASERTLEGGSERTRPTSWTGRPRPAWAVAAGLVLVLGISGVLARMWFVADGDAQAIVETVDGTLYRLSGSAPLAIGVGDRVRMNERLRTNGGAGAQLVLADTSRIEMRSQSELLLERADDGVRIRLTRGGIIVNAAKQRTGHLYVTTRDVTVSVVGTVFLVDTAEQGSRVAVIEGEVRVQQGETEKKLLPGQQLATSPLMAAPTLPQGISWSRNASAHLALLQQVTTAPGPATPDQQAEPREIFDLAAIRPTRFASGGERGAGSGGRSSVRPAGEPCGDHPNSFFLKFDPSRAMVSDMTLYGLITWAYELSCRPHVGAYLLSGGPGWVRSDGYDIDALIPEGPPAFATTQVAIGGGKTATQQTMTPRFRKMLQALLTDRFKLVVRREMRNVPVYTLSVAPGGPKLATWKEGDPTSVNELYDRSARDGTLLSAEELAAMKMTAEEVRELHASNPRQLERLMYQASQATGINTSLAGVKSTLSELVDQVNRTIDPSIHRPILDRTGLTGQFVFRLRFNRTATGPGDPGVSVFTALEQQLGLRLEPSTTPMEVYIIERAERPTPN